MTPYSIYFGGNLQTIKKTGRFLKESNFLTNAKREIAKAIISHSLIREKQKCILDVKIEYE